MNTLEANLKEFESHIETGEIQALIDRGFTRAQLAMRYGLTEGWVRKYVKLGLIDASKNQRRGKALIKPHEVMRDFDYKRFALYGKW